MFRRTLALLACLLWITGGTVARLHEAFVTHVVCAEHGVVEHADSVDAPVAETDTPSISSAADIEHAESCTEPLVETPLPSSPGAAFSGLVLGVSAPDKRLVEPGAPRGPPLRNAPKTSPPVV